MNEWKNNNKILSSFDEPLSNFSRLFHVDSVWRTLAIPTFACPDNLITQWHAQSVSSQNNYVLGRQLVAEFVHVSEVYAEVNPTPPPHPTQSLKRILHSSP